MGYDRLGDSYRRFLGVYLSMMSIGQIAGAFFNIFLLRATGSSVTLMIFNVLLATVQPFVMAVAVFAVRRFSVIQSQRVAFVLLMIAYTILAVWIDRVESLVYLIAVLMSASNAFFFTSYTPMMLSYTTDGNRDAAGGVLSFFTTLLSVVIPVATGFFISSFGDLTGYRVLFVIAVCMCVFTFFLSFRLAPVTGFHSERRTQFRSTLRYIVKSKPMMVAMVNPMIYASIATAPAYFGALIVMELIGRESQIGLITFLGSIVTMAAAVVYGRIVKPQNRAKWMMTGLGVVLLAVCGMIADLSVVTYVLYSAAAAFAAIFLTNPPLMNYLAVLQRIPELSQRGPEVHTLRELFVGAGRALGVLPVLFFQDAFGVAVYMILTIYAVQIFSILLARYMSRYLNAAREGESGG